MEVTDLQMLDDPGTADMVRERLSVLQDREPLVVRPRPHHRLELSGEAVTTLRSLPTVTVLVADAHTIDPATAGAFDVCLAIDGPAPPPFVDAPVEPVVAAVSSHPLAALGLVTLLRDPRASTHAGIAAESAVYAALLGSDDFHRWLAGRAHRPATPSDRPVGVEVHDRARVIRLQRPDCRNAIDSATRDAFVEALHEAASGHVDQVVVRGDGPAFSAGGDLREFGTVGDPATAHAVRLTRHPGAALAGVGATTTALVHGACVGAGIEIAAFADRVVATPDAWFSLPELAYGLVPGAGGTVSVPRRIGAGRAAWMALTGEEVDAATALDWGLVDAVVEDLDAVAAHLVARGAHPDQLA